MDATTTIEEEEEELEQQQSPPPPPSLPPPAGLTPLEYTQLKSVISSHHRQTYHSQHQTNSRCSSLLSQRTSATPEAVWSIVRRFDRPQIYKHFIRSCSLLPSSDHDYTIRVGSLRELSVISGLPASTSTERLDMLDEHNRVFGFSIVGGEHRLRNYTSVTTVNQITDNSMIWTVVLESYVVDVPQGNTDEDTRLFADTVVRLNLQKLASVAEFISKSPPFVLDSSSSSSSVVSPN